MPRVATSIIPLQSRCQRRKSLFLSVSEIKCRNRPATGYKRPQDLVEQVVSDYEGTLVRRRMSRTSTRAVTQLVRFQSLG